MKTWKDIRVETLNLGFEKTKAYEKNKQAYVDAYNWAQALIASITGGVIERIGVECNGNHRHIFDLHEMAKGEGKEFIGISQLGVVDTKNNRVDGWSLTDNRFFIMPEGFNDNRVIMALVMPVRITVKADDNTECQLPDKWANLVPYLMANRLYLDDDAGKAGYYWNLFVEMRDAILLKENEPVVAITEGIDIDGWCCE